MKQEKKIKDLSNSYEQLTQQLDLQEATTQNLIVRVALLESFINGQYK